MVKLNKIKDEKHRMDIIDLEQNGKHMLFHLTDLGFLKVELFYEQDEKDFWFYEDFVIDKENEDLYNLVDKIFFSYGGETFFSAEGSNLKLNKEDNGYKFKFIRSFNNKCNNIEAIIMDDTIENRSLNHLYSDLVDYEPVKKDTAVKKLLKSKKNVES